MEFLSNIKWFCCQDKIPLFQYRVVALLFITTVIGLIVPLLPVMAVINPVFREDILCKFEGALLMYHGICYALGLSTLIMLMVVILLIVHIGIYLNAYVKSISSTGCKVHCITRHECGIVDIPGWSFYIIGVILSSVIGVSAYYMTITVYNEVTVAKHFALCYILSVVMLMALSSFLFLLYSVASSCCQKLKEYRTKVTEETTLI